jgi:long-chain acyl-CoA synthetase
MLLRTTAQSDVPAASRSGVGCLTLTCIHGATEMKLVICDTGRKASMLVKASKNMPTLKTLVVIQETTLTDDIIDAGKDTSIEILSFPHMMEVGRNCIHSPVPPKPETICTICYTSGTTGNPKGVIVSHRAMIANIAAAIHHVDTLFTMSNEDIHLAYLPLAHMFERLNQLLMLQHGAKIGFNSGDIRQLLEDLAILKPTFFPTVPRLLNRIFDKVQQTLAGNPVKTALFNLAINRKMVLLKRFLTRPNGLDLLS